MATLTITEYASLARDKDGNVIPAGDEPAVTIQTVSYTTSANSAAFNTKTHFVRLYGSAAAYVIFGSGTQTATASHTPLAATTAEYFGVKPGHQLAAYDGSS